MGVRKGPGTVSECERGGESTNTNTRIARARLRHGRPKAAFHPIPSLCISPPRTSAIANASVGFCRRTVSSIRGWVRAGAPASLWALLRGSTLRRWKGDKQSGVQASGQLVSCARRPVVAQYCTRGG